jgi:hypothetical protein
LVQFLMATPLQFKTHAQEGNSVFLKLFVSIFYKIFSEEDWKMYTYIYIYKINIIELSIKSPCLHLVFGPHFTPYPFF